MVGNSLLLHGVEMNRLQALTCASMRIYPIFLEATGYYDWLYGLQRLFRQGARPQVVVVGVGVNYFLENGVRQDYAPMLFFDARDTLAVASDLRLDRTATSNLLLAHRPFRRVGSLNKFPFLVCEGCVRYVKSMEPS